MTDMVSYGTIYGTVSKKEYPPNTPLLMGDFTEEAWNDHVAAGMIVPATKHPLYNAEAADEAQRMSAAVPPGPNSEAERLGMQPTQTPETAEE